MKRVLLAMAVAMIGVGAAVAADQTGQGLDVTLAFVRDKVAQQRPDLLRLHQPQFGGRRRIGALSSAPRPAMSPRTRPPATSAFPLAHTVDGKAGYDVEGGIPFAKVDHVVITSMEADIARINAEAGHPTWTAKVTRRSWVLTAYRADGRSNSLDFATAIWPSGVARAVRHARGALWRDQARSVLEAGAKPSVRMAAPLVAPGRSYRAALSSAWIQSIGRGAVRPP